MRVHICSFSGALGDLPKKWHGDDGRVLEVLASHPRFTCWDVTPRLGSTLDSLRTRGRLRYPEPQPDYPWCLAQVLPEPTPCAPCGGRGAFHLVGRHHAVCHSCQGNGWKHAPSPSEKAQLETSDSAARVFPEGSKSDA